MTTIFSGKLDVVLLAGVVLLTAYLMLMAVNNSTSPLVITRGTSMEPTYHQGDLLAIRRVAPVEIEVGDVIVFETSGDVREDRLPDLIAHRVTSIGASSGKFVFKTQGDNSAADPFGVDSSQVRGVVVGNLGPVGKLFLVQLKMQSLLLLLVPVGVFLGFLWLAASWLNDSQATNKKRPITSAETNE
jgi:signal peptidase I